jgi:2-(1,2-epoxy-1,2-dihydrophenyl)acetyl-CoA isomerase
MRLPVVEGIEVTVREHVAEVVLDRPAKLNAMTHAMMDGLPEVLHALSADNGVRCVVLTGRGRAFCAGGDLSTVNGSEGFTEGGLVARMDRRHAAAELLHTMPKPTLARVNGIAAGAGLSLALACDVRIAGASAKLVSAFTQVGFCGDYGGTWTLQRLIGPERARAFYFAGETIDAAEAARLGMVSRVVPDADLEAVTWQLARRIADGPPLAIARMKQNMNAALTCDLGALLSAESRATVALMRSRDNREALAAFAEKRAPQFSGE